MVIGPLIFFHDTSPVTILPIIFRLNTEVSQVFASACTKRLVRRITHFGNKVLSKSRSIIGEAPILPYGFAVLLDRIGRHIDNPLCRRRA